MVLSHVLDSLVYTLRQKPVHKELVNIPIEKVTNDSREVVQGSLFVCIKGAVVDGHQYIEEVIEKGSVAIIVEKSRVLSNIPEDITVIEVSDSRLALAKVSAAYYQYPAEKLRIIGITGTKGKTTTTYMVRDILERVGYKVGLIGTIETIMGDIVIPASNTTPESITIQKYFRKMVDLGCDTVVMEVSSQGLMLQRTAGIPFEIGIFTNLGDDHIGPNEHRDFQHYLESKALLFQQCEIGIGNVDDPHFQKIFAKATCEMETYGMTDKADLRAKKVELITKKGILGVGYQVCGLMDFPVEVPVPGIFSVYNSLTAIAVCRHFQVPEKEIQKALKQVKVRGRIEGVQVSEAFTVMIDYAHNAMSLESLLTTLRAYNPNRLICVFGCGGNRAKSRRYEMGEVSGRLADLTVITSDNPRYEEPQDIIDDIKVGIVKTCGAYVEFCDRIDGIRYAINHGQKGDIIIIAGKGHEDYQEVLGVKYPMDDRMLIANIMAER